MAKQYCEISDIENYLTLEIADEFESVAEGWIEAISNMIKLLTNRDWLADSVATARFYDGNNCSELTVDDFIGTPVVEIGDDYAENLVATTDFITKPYNTTNKNVIKLKEDSFDKGEQNVRVTVKWGYAQEVPADIKLATTVIASAVILAQTNQDGEIESEKIGNYTVKYKDDQHRNDAKLAMGIIQQRKVLIVV
jgi:hypothetical protein